MLINYYARPYLDFYHQLNLLSMGTIFKVDIPVTKENKYLQPKNYRFRLDNLVSENVDHFVLFISQFEKGSFESIQNQVYSDFAYCNDMLNEDQNIIFNGVGSIRIFNKKVTLFPENNPRKTFGYPEIKIKK